MISLYFSYKVRNFFAVYSYVVFSSVLGQVTKAPLSHLHACFCRVNVKVYVRSSLLCTALNVDHAKADRIPGVDINTLLVQLQPRIA